jgi:hypothetical protein
MSKNKASSAEVKENFRFNFNDARRFLKRLLLADEYSTSNITPMLWGPPGIGKSAMVKLLQKEMGYDRVITMLVGLKNPIDISGVPYVLQKTMKPEDVQIEYLWKGEKFAYIPLDIFADIKIGEKVILFLDEVNTGTHLNQVQAFQVALDRQVGELKLGKNVRVIMAGNRVQDSSAVINMSNPLKTRLTHVEMFADADEFIVDFFKTLHPSITAFLRNNKDYIHLNEFNVDSEKKNLKTDIEENHNTFPCPRNWIMLSDYLYANPPEFGKDKQGKLVNFNQIEPREIAGIVGESVATKFHVFYSYESRIPNTYDIIMGVQKYEQFKSHPMFNDSKSTDLGFVSFYYLASLSKNLINALEKLHLKYVNENSNDEATLKKNIRAFLVNFYFGVLPVEAEFSAYVNGLVMDKIKELDSNLSKIVSDIQVDVLTNKSFEKMAGKISLLGDTKSE